MFTDSLPLASVLPPAVLSFLSVLALVLCDFHQIRSGRYIFKPIAAAAFLPKDTRMKISDITVTGEEGQDYHRRVMSLDVVPKQSVLLRTLDGDTITWSLFANGGQDVFVELKDGTSFKKSAICSAVSLCYVICFLPLRASRAPPLPTSSSTHAAHLLSSSLI